MARAGDSAEHIVRELRGHSAFAKAADAALVALSAHARICDFEAGQVIAQAGSPPAHVFVLLAGVVRVYHRSEDGRECTVKHLSPPVTFNEMEALAGCELLENAEAMTASRAVQLPAEDFLRFLDREPGAGVMMLRDVCGRFCVAARRERAILVETPVRLASLLLSYADLFGRPVPDGIQIHRALTQEDLANGLGVVVRSVRRILSDWKEKGWVSTRKGWIIVHLPHELEQICGELRFSLNYRAS